MGFATVAAASIELSQLPRRVRSGLPRYPIPALRLGRLAVSETDQRKGIGRALLAEVLGLAVAQSQASGCFGVLVDAKDGAKPFYEKHGFEVLVAEEGVLSSTTPMFLHIKTILAALSGRGAARPQPGSS